MERHDIILVCVGVYMLACLGGGIWAMRRTRSSQDFFMAGRSLGVLVTGFAVFSSTMSGFGFVGGPGLVYAMGLSSVWMVVCSTMGNTFSFLLLGKRLRFLAELRDTVSLPEAIHARYRSELTRFLSATAIILGVGGYLGTQVKAMGTVLSTILASHPDLPSVSIEMAMFISCAVLAFYCATGGILAGVYTDLLQGGVMVVAAIFVFVTAIGSVDGGVSGISETLANDDPESVSPWGTFGALGCLSWYFLFACGAAGQPHVITKLMMTKRVADARTILPLSFIAFTLSALLWIGIGTAMRTLVIQGEHAALSEVDHAAPEFLNTYAHPLLAGLVFAGLFAAIMSTADSFLNIGAAACVNDLPKSVTAFASKFCSEERVAHWRAHPLFKNQLMWARIATVGLLYLAAMFALYTEDFLALLGAFGWGTFAAALVPTVAIGFNWKRATATAANVAMAVSLAINFTVQLRGIKLPYGVSVGAVSLLVSLTLFFGISLLSKPQPIDKDVEAVMDL
ncbi:MAG: sodium/proline symporter [Planctomycetota bacterium]